MKHWKQETNPKEKYQMYLASREWGLLKRQVHERSGGICERCHGCNGQAVHHITYERKYNERLDDLIHLCKGCHDFQHGHSDADPRFAGVEVYRSHDENHQRVLDVMNKVAGCPPLRFDLEKVVDWKGQLNIQFKSDDERFYDGYLGGHMGLGGIFYTPLARKMIRLWEEDHGEPDYQVHVGTYCTVEGWETGNDDDLYHVNYNGC